MESASGPESHEIANPGPWDGPICKRASVHTGGQFKVGDLYFKEIQLPIKKK